MREGKVQLTRRDFIKQSLYWGAMACSFSVFGREVESHGADMAEILQGARYYEKLPQDRVRCHFCFRGCEISEGKRGFCRNRENVRGTLYSIVYAKPAALQADPIEKEPSFHMIPGSTIFCTAVPPHL